MSESTPMKWSELRERVQEFLDCRTYDQYDLIRVLIRDIDAAAPAMEIAEKSAECWRRYVWLTEEAMRKEPRDMNVRGAVFLRECIHDSCETPFEEWINEQTT